MVEATLRKARIGTLFLQAALAISAVFLPSRVSAHPIHTSLAEVVHEASSRTVRISLRVFVDDYTTASLAHVRWLASRRPPRTAPDGQSPFVTYAQAAFRVTDATGRRIPLTSCGGRRNGDLMWLCLKGSAPRGLSGLSITSHVLFDMYRDQINIVQAAYGGRKTSLLFTRGDGARKLP
ncbi:MAG: DUF6702 family protein [Gemmatimonadaceae bacterium]